MGFENSPWSCSCHSSGEGQGAQHGVGGPSTEQEFLIWSRVLRHGAGVPGMEQGSLIWSRGPWHGAGIPDMEQGSLAHRSRVLLVSAYPGDSGTVLKDVARTSGTQQRKGTPV